MERKNDIRGILAVAMVAVIYHLIVFLIPFVKNSVFWLSYGITLVAFVVAVVALMQAFKRGSDAQSKFYGFPIAKIGVLYGGAQVLACIVFMALAKWMLLWVAALVQGAGLAVAVLGLVAADTVRDAIEEQDVQLRQTVSRMRAIQSRVNQLPGQVEDTEALKAVRAFAEEVRYSDPVSSDDLAEIENDLSAAVDELQQAVVEGDAEAVITLTKKAMAVLTERNRLCKLYK